MPQSEKDTLVRLRQRIAGGEKFNPTLLTRFGDLVAQEAREEAGKNTTIISPHSSFFPFVFSATLFILYCYMLKRISSNHVPSHADFLLLPANKNRPRMEVTIR